MELTKEQIDSIYRIIEKARDTGKIKKGTNEVTKSVEKGEATFVILAEDVNPKEIVMHIPMLCEEKKISFTWVPTKAELGASAGLTAQASCVAIVDAGEAKKILLKVLSDLQNLQRKETKPQEIPKKVEEPKVEAPKQEKAPEPKEEKKPVEEKKEEKPSKPKKEPVKEEKKPEKPKKETKSKKSE